MFVMQILIVSFKRKLVTWKAKIINEKTDWIKTGIRVINVKIAAGPAAFWPLSWIPANLKDDLFGFEKL